MKLWRMGWSLVAPVAWLVWALGSLLAATLETQLVSVWGGLLLSMVTIARIWVVIPHMHQVVTLAWILSGSYLLIHKWQNLPRIDGRGNPYILNGQTFRCWYRTYGVKATNTCIYQLMWIPALIVLGTAVLAYFAWNIIGDNKFLTIMAALVLMRIWARSIYFVDVFEFLQILLDARKHHSRISEETRQQMMPRMYAPQGAVRSTAVAVQPVKRSAPAPVALRQPVPEPILAQAKPEVVLASAQTLASMFATDAIEEEPDEDDADFEDEDIDDEDEEDQDEELDEEEDEPVAEAEPPPAVADKSAEVEALIASALISGDAGKAARRRISEVMFATAGNESWMFAWLADALKEAQVSAESTQKMFDRMKDTATDANLRKSDFGNLVQKVYIQWSTLKDAPDELKAFLRGKL